MHDMMGGMGGMMWGMGLMRLVPDGAPLPANPGWEAYGKQGGSKSASKPIAKRVGGEAA